MAVVGYALVVAGFIGAVVVFVRQIRHLDRSPHRDDRLSGLSRAQRRALCRTIARRGTVTPEQEQSAQALAQQLSAQRQTLPGPVVGIVISVGLLLGLPADGSTFARVLDIAFAVSIVINGLAVIVCVRQSRAGDRFLETRSGGKPAL